MNLFDPAIMGGPPRMIKLRPRQQKLVDDIDAAIASGARRIMVQAPTGFGKTIIAAYFANRCAERGQRKLFTVPALTLIKQTVDRFYENGIWDVGVIQANHELTNFSMPIQVASVQTLQRRKIIPRADLVMIDEAHRWFEFYKKWFLDPEWADVPFIGLSATPWTVGLGKYFDHLIIASTVRELIDENLLAPFRVFAPGSPDLSDVRTVAGDYHEGDLSGVMNDIKLVADVVSTWIDKANGAPTLCFAVDRAHAKHLQRQFIDAGVPTGYIDAFTEKPDREDIQRHFQSGALKVVCNVGCLTTGVDWDVRCIILARPTKSEMLFVQMIGRGLRTAAGKDHCLVLDHSDNHTRLGFVTDIHYDYLDDGNRAKKKAAPKESLPKKCPACSFLRPPKVPQCPSCGFMPKPTCGIKNAAGELVELASRLKQKEVIADNKRLYAELLYYANQRGYKPGWASVNYRERVGGWPPREWVTVPPVEPTRETLNWIKSKMIAYVKARGDQRSYA